MKTLLLIVVTGLLCVTTTVASPPKPKKMKAFTSERELQLYFRQVAEKQKLEYERQRALYLNEATVEVSASVSADESVTNTQVEGVDEGGIVKVYGDYLVLLRRGRLFTVKIGDGALKPVSAVDAFGPDIDPHRSWYDEMLISGNTVVVIGYSYSREGTEVGLFNIDVNGHLSYRSTYHLRSNDYYSSRNYASRLIGSKLIFYTPLYYYSVSEPDPLKAFPSVRKWHKDATSQEFRRIVSAKRIYRPEVEIHAEYGITLHTVTICDLANGGFDCQATSVIGPPGNVFYVSPDSVYVWTSTWERGAKQGPSVLFRLPLDGSGPGALRVSGGPVDQFSFLESEDHFLNVLVRSAAYGDGMWRAEVAEGDVALMRVPLWSFSDGAESVPATSYRELPKVEGYFQNRFVGDYLLYGSGNGWGYPGATIEGRDLYVVNWATGNWQQFRLPHGVDRIDQMGKRAAVVIGTDGKDLHFTSIRLDLQSDIVSRYTREGASQGELRSHGFFYKPDGDNSGTLGLPISRPGRPGFEHLFETSAAVLFLRNEGMTFRVLGELEARPDKALDDRCRASCVDWYGNARPLFLRGRMFALLGYELVEGKFEDSGLRELRRITYAPKPTEP